MTEGVRMNMQPPSKPLEASIKNPKSIMLSCFVYQKSSFSELSHSKITNWEIPLPFMTFNVIAKNQNKSGTTLLSRNLIPLNETFYK